MYRHRLLDGGSRWNWVDRVDIEGGRGSDFIGYWKMDYKNGYSTSIDPLCIHHHCYTTG